MNTCAIYFNLAILLGSLQTAFSQDDTAKEDHNISISSKIENYEFVKGDDSHPVLIRGEITTIYRCNGFRTSIPIVELYDDYSSVDISTVSVNGHNDYKVEPNYSYYPVNDVFYSDARIFYFNLPLEKRNSESRVKLKKTINDPRYFTSLYFDENYYLENKTVSIRVPNWMKLEIREFNFELAGILIKKEQDAENIIYTYTIRNRPVRKQLEYAPGGSYIYPHILLLPQSAQPAELPKITYFQNLQDLYDWSYAITKQTNNDASSFSMQVKGLTRDKVADTEKLQAVFQWVQANIRYIAFENGIAAFKPESAQEVYRKKYGDCKGMANLTKEMLKSIGFDARLAWLGTKQIAYDHSIPSLAVDNHLICAVLLNGKFIFLDATEKYIGLGEYSERIQGRQVLIENGAHYILEYIPTALPDQNTVLIKRFLEIDSLDITGTVEQILKGESKEYLHYGMNSIATNKREISLKQYLTDDNPNYKIQDLVVTGLQDWNKNIVIKYKVQQTNAVASFGDERYVNIEFKNDVAGLKIDTLREQDMWLPYKLKIIDTTELTLPAGYTAIQFPQPVSIKNDSCQVNLQYKYTGKKILYTREIIIKSAVIKTQQFKSWNETLRMMNTFYKEQIVLRKS